MLKSASRILAVIILVYLGLGFLYARLTPAWQAPDEPAHYNYVQAVAETGRLPVLVDGCYDETYLNEIKSRRFPPELPIHPICYEHYQPPLYYLLSAPIFILSGGNLLALRLFSVFLGGLSLILVFRTVALFLDDPAIVLSTTAFVAFVPMHLTMLSSVNNDSLAELLFILLVFLLLHWLLQTREATRSLPWTAGVVLGLILITKVTIYIGLPLVALVLVLGDRRPGALLQNAVRAFLPALLIPLPLYIRNSLVYGGLDILGLRRHDAVVVGQLRTADWLAQIGPAAYLQNLFRTLFHSFWGQFGWMAVPMDNRVYLVLLIVQVLALCGLGLWLWHSRPWPNRLRLSLGVMLTIIRLAGLGFGGLKLSFVQFQGRYFFTALMPLGLFFSLGLQEALRRRWALLMAAPVGMILAWVGLSSVLGGGLDKWGLLLSGLILVGLLVRRWLPIEDGRWGLAGFYLALAGLAAASPTWFIVPNL